MDRVAYYTQSYCDRFDSVCTCVCDRYETCRTRVDPIWFAETMSTISAPEHVCADMSVNKIPRNPNKNLCCNLQSIGPFSMLICICSPVSGPKTCVLERNHNTFTPTLNKMCMLYTAILARVIVFVHHVIACRMESNAYTCNGCICPWSNLGCLIRRTERLYTNTINARYLSMCGWLGAWRIEYNYSCANTEKQLEYWNT